MASFTSNSERSIMVLLTAAVLMASAMIMNVVWPDESIDAQKREDAYWLHKVHGYKAASANIVLSGDSRVYRGLSPAVFEQTLIGMKTINFGFSSGGHNPIIFAEIDRLLKTGGARAVVLGITPWSLTSKAQENAQFVDYKRKHESVDETKLGHILRPLSFAHVKNIAQGKVEKKSSSFTQDFREDGWVRSDDAMRNPIAALSSYAHLFDGNKVDPTVIAVILAQVSTWHDRGIAVIGYRPPTSAAMVKLENEASGYNEALFAAEFRKAGGFWVDLPDSFETYDGSHLTPESAEKLSKVLAEAIEAAW
ncbi:MAG TPA: hypothetical protein VIN59_08965 [Alphaproteobacteria bacterium]